MKKTLITFIWLLVALTLACILFVFGREYVRNNASDETVKEEIQKYQTDKKEKKSEDAVSGDKKKGNTDKEKDEEEKAEEKAEEKEKDEEKEEAVKGEELDIEDEKTSEEKENKGFVLDENPAPTESQNNKKEQPQENIYRVRKSASDASSQKGAFQNLENAKAMADSLKGEGYAVYDENLECVYKP